MTNVKALPWRLLAVAGSGWCVFVAIRYALLIGELPAGQNRRLFSSLQEFFFGQAAGYLALCLLVPIFARADRLGRLAGVYLAGSTVALWAFSRELWLPLTFGLFVFWVIATASSLRLMVSRFLGRDHATWGLAIPLMFSLAIPISFVLGWLKVMNVGVVSTVAVAVALPGAVDLWRGRRHGAPSIGRWLEGLSPLGAVALGAIWISLAIAWVWSNAPESAPDSMRWHLPHIQHMVRSQGFEPLHVYYTYLMPNAVQAFFASGFVVGSVQVAKWLSWLSMLGLALLVLEEVTRRSGNQNLGLLGGAATLAHPMLLSLSATLYIDHVIALMCVSAFVVLFRGLHAGSHGVVVLSALMMGCAAQTKHNVLIFCVLWGVFLTIAAVRRYRLWPGIRWSLVPVVCFLAAACPWYFYAFATTGNPVYPWFNEWFHSPLWPEGESADFIRAKFDLEGGTLGWLKFPWVMTYRSSEIAHALDGGLGFQLLAWLPFAGVFLARRAWAHLDLGLGGLAMFLSVGLYSPYARYWLSAYPLMVMALVLALGLCFDRIHWRPPKGVVALTSAGVFVGLLLSIPFWRTGSLGFPWDFYTKQISQEEWFLRHTRGYPAIAELNRKVQPSDRILATPRVATYTIDATAQVFPFWHTSINGIQDATSFESFLRSNKILYWIVDFGNAEVAFFDKLVDAKTRYWTDSRLVAAESTFAVFDVSQAGSAGAFTVIERRGVPSQVHPKSGWRDLKPKEAAAALQSSSDSIGIPPGGATDHRFELPADADFFRTRIELQSEGLLTGIVLTVDWLDEAHQSVGQIFSRLRLRSHRQHVELFGEIPSGAVRGRLRIIHDKSKLVRLRETRLTFLARRAY